MSPGRDLGGGRGEPGLPPTPAGTGTRGCGRRSAGGYWVAVERHRWRRPADEQGRVRLTRIAVDRGAKPQTVRVISAPLILDGPGRPGAGRSSSRCCAVMDVTRFKDAGPAVSRICGHGSPIPISTQVRGILAIWAHRCAAAIGSAHRRAPRRRQSVPSGPDRPHGGHSSLTARARCATRPHLSLLTKSRRTPTVHIPRHILDRRHPNRPRLPTDSRTATDTAGDIPRGRARLSAARGIRRRRGQQSRPRARETPPAGRKCPRTRRMSPGMPASSR